MSGLIEPSEALEALVARAMPAVVGVHQGRGQGTGLLIAQDGYLLTNHHVAGDGRALRVRLPDGERVPAERVGSDPATDLAVLRIDRTGLPSLSLSEGRPPSVGQLVVAVGNPYRFERSVSLGIISALDRSLPGPDGSSFEGLIQTDAAINPGNSGGPLINAYGEVVGINTAAIPYAQGMGFAVNARTAGWVTAVLMQHGQVRRRHLGVAARAIPLEGRIQALAGQMRAVHVLDVAKGSPADFAGLRSDDYLLQVHGEAVSSVDDVHRLLVLRGRKDVPLTVLRDGQRRALTVATEALRAAA